MGWEQVVVGEREKGWGLQRSPADNWVLTMRPQVQTATCTRETCGRPGRSAGGFTLPSVMASQCVLSAKTIPHGRAQPCETPGQYVL